MSFRYHIDVPLDSPERTKIHGRILREKPFLLNLFKDWYQALNQSIKGLPDGKIVELGSGGGFMKEIIPDSISSDIISIAGTDLTFSALDMPFEKEALSALLMIDTFHHIPDSALFLEEADRVLKKDGILMMIEPANSWWGRFIFRNIHHEPFVPEGDWNIIGSGPLSGANIALPWIVFVRDKSLFSEKFPGFCIEEISFHTPFRYLLSGGFTCKSFVPGFTYPFFRTLDHFFSSVSKNFSMFMTIRIRKTGE